MTAAYLAHMHFRANAFVDSWTWISWRSSLPPRPIQPEKRARTALALAMLVTSSGAFAASAGMQFLRLPLQIGDGTSSSITVGRFLDCLEHDPIPLKLSDVSDMGAGRFLVRVENDLQQYEMTFEQASKAAHFLKLNGNNGPPLSSPEALDRFVTRACRQARIGK